jgi:flagellin
VFTLHKSASSSVTETKDGAEAVAVSQKSSLGISGSLASGKTVQLILTANGPDKLSSGSDQVTTTITHTAAANMTGAEVAAALATKISSAYTLTSNGNNLTVTTNTGGDAGGFTVALKDDAVITGTYLTSVDLLSETKVQTAAKDGAATATDTTISSIAVTDGTKAAAAIAVIDNALKTVGQERAKLGAFQNRLTHAVNNMTNMSANTASAKSVVADADYAAESSSLAKNQILQQAGTAMLAQANAQAQSVLSLLK